MDKETGKKLMEEADALIVAELKRVRLQLFSLINEVKSDGTPEQKEILADIFDMCVERIKE